jgi:hypothetical protein
VLGAHDDREPFAKLFLKPPEEGNELSYIIYNIVSKLAAVVRLVHPTLSSY